MTVWAQAAEIDCYGGRTVDGIQRGVQGTSYAAPAVVSFINFLKRKHQFTNIKFQGWNDSNMACDGPTINP